MGYGTTTVGYQPVGGTSADVLVFDAATGISEARLTANLADALSFEDTNGDLAVFDTRNTVKNASTVTITGVACTVASEAAAHTNPSLALAAKTLTYTGGTGTTSSLGIMLHIGAATITDVSAMTLTTASAVHITALAAAGGSLTISNSRMISTSVSDCFLTNAGVWTDTASWGGGKSGIMDAPGAFIEETLDAIQPRTWKYREDIHGDDRGRQRVGIVAEELPEQLRVPGQENPGGLSAGVLGSFSLAALKHFHDEIRGIKRRLDDKESEKSPSPKAGEHYTNGERAFPATGE